MHKISAILIDDEKHARVLLREVIERYIPEIELLAEGHDLESGIELIKQHQPNLVFLDIEMPQKNGLRIVSEFDDEINFEIIFVTAYNQYAIDALRLSAFDYLLKPITPTDLKEAIERYKREIQSQSVTNHHKEQFETAVHNLTHPDQEARKIILKTHNGRFVVKVEEIVCLRADGQYTYFQLENKQEIMASKPLIHFEKILEKGFFRVHRSYLVHKKFIDYDAPFKQNLRMTNGIEVLVSRSKKKEVEALLLKGE